MSELQGLGTDTANEETVTRPVRLREAREAAGLHIAALAAALKVPVKKLEALEAGRYGELPDLTFARALASSACRHLKIDSAPVLAQIPLGAAFKLGDRSRTLNAPFHSGEEQSPQSPLSWLSRPALLATIALLLGALVIVFLPRADQPAEPAMVLEQPTAVEPAPVIEVPVAQVPADTFVPTEPLPDILAAPATDPAPVGSSPVGSGSLLNIAATGESWVEVVNGAGVVVTKRLLKPGDAIDFSAAPPYTVVLGKADAARVSVRGQAFDTTPFARNNVARFEVK